VAHAEARRRGEKQIEILLEEKEAFLSVLCVLCGKTFLKGTAMGQNRINTGHAAGDGPDRRGELERENAALAAAAKCPRCGEIAGEGMGCVECGKVRVERNRPKTPETPTPKKASPAQDRERVFGRRGPRAGCGGGSRPWTEKRDGVAR
jgi:hypothetical protein